MFNDTISENQFELYESEDYVYNVHFVKGLDTIPT